MSIRRGQERYATNNIHFIESNTIANVINGENNALVWS